MIIKPCPLAARMCCTFRPTTFSSVQFSALPYIYHTIPYHTISRPTSFSSVQCPEQFEVLNFANLQCNYVMTSPLPQAFGALRNVVCDRDLKARTRGIVCKVLVATVLLHGAECWAMKDSHVRAITTFHRRCVRSMCHVTMRTTRQFHIKTTTLEERLGVVPIVQSYHRRLLGWAGAVLRMPMDRLPRQMC